VSFFPQELWAHLKWGLAHEPETKHSTTKIDYSPSIIMNHPSDPAGPSTAISRQHRHKKSQEKWFQGLALITVSFAAVANSKRAGFGLS
jgi:hypothetical protein